jgi:iron complex transport system ATP-binding protein
VTAALETDRLSVELSGNEILRGVTLAVEHGEWLGLIGPNGAGKTTLLRAISGLVPSAGRVSVDGTTLTDLSRREVARRLALVPQNPHVPAELTVAEYVLLGRTPFISYFGTETRADRLAAERAMARLALRAFAPRRLGSLSGGELQRAVLARALAQEASILLLDEPTSALDLGRQQQVLELVDELRRDAELTVVAAMHDLTLASQYVDRMLLMNRGITVGEGTPDEVVTEATVNEYYGASVQIFRDNGSTFVVPRRPGRR